MTSGSEPTEASAEARRAWVAEELPAGSAEHGPVASEILSFDRLGEHALEVAREHGSPSLLVSARPLLASFRATKKAIEAAYQGLALEARAKRDPTPAEEWLEDNSHVIQDQLREIEEDLPSGYLKKLPRLAKGTLAGYPRVYGLALDLISHTDGWMDFATLVHYVKNYQTLRYLTIGELWAVPIMLRFGLTQRVLTLAERELAIGKERARADVWAERMLERAAHRPSDVAVTVAELAQSDEPFEPAFLVQLLRRLREHDAQIASAYHWVHERCLELGIVPEQATRGEHLRQAASQVSMGNAITGMRVITALDWNKFFEQTSAVEEALRGDPAGAYVETEPKSRDRYRHAVEDLAAGSGVSEVTVARAAVKRAGSGHGPRGGHVGYYLIDKGRRALEEEIGYRAGALERVSRSLSASAIPLYFAAITLGTAASVAGLVALGRGRGGAPLAVLVALGLLLCLPCSEIVVMIVNWLVTVTVKPRLLAKLAFDEGLPDGCRTLVVVPALIGSEEAVRDLLEDLEVRSLANPGKNLHFALLSDFPDASVEERPGEAELLATALRLLAEMNERHEPGGKDRFLLLHRRRIHNAAQGRWMGWERKRGKLDELNRLLRGGAGLSFTVVTGDRALLESIRYVLTLDTDTRLPRDVAQRLVGTLAHPLNQPELDATGTRVVSGYGVIQPRVSTTLDSAGRSLFARIHAGAAGIDPYTTAVSDVYEDLFGEGVYIGKALYEVDAFLASTRDRIPENRLLSHDLFEGLYARTALVTDIELLDDQPSSYAVHTGRVHRWVRGDWQLASWALPWVPKPGGGTRRNDLPLLGRWKILDNLRRSLLAPSIVALLAFGFLVTPRTSALWMAVAALTLTTPMVGRLATALVRPDEGKGSRAFFGALFGDLRANAVQVGLSATFLLDQSILMLDAIARTLYRLAARRNLLEWMTAGEAERRSALGRLASLPRMWIGAAVSAAVAGTIAVQGHGSELYAIPILLLWALAPLVASAVSRPIPPRERVLSATDRSALRKVARKTWRFFDVFVTAEDHWLPPDNFQESPKGVVAHRTSPTNLGLYLLSTVAARDFGYVTLGQLADRLSNTLDTLDALDRHEGHVLNWYDTASLKALEPRYVSTVDSGNLAAHLWTLRQACVELEDRPVVEVAVLDASLDAMALFREALEARAAAPDAPAQAADAALPGCLPAALAADLESFLVELAEARRTPPRSAAAWLATLDQLALRAEPLAAWGREWRVVPDARAALSYWLGRAFRGLAEAAAELEEIAPWIRALAEAPPGLARGARATLWSALREDLEACPTPRIHGERAPTVVAGIGALDEALGGATDLDEASRTAARSFLVTLQAQVALGAQRSAAILDRLTSLGARAAALADGMRFGMLYDKRRALFAIGYDVGSGRLDGSHYDLLASEARLASLVAIAKGDVPQEHWFRLGRQLTRSADRRALLSWSGSMFEYLMPLLVTRTYERTLLDETYVAVLRRQREYAARKGVPWGISESAYNTLDLGLTYQYHAFGVPGLGLKSGLADDLVVAPYATLLASLVSPDLASRNLRALAKEGLDGAYGFYESIDYTPSHVPPGRKGVVVKAFMAHHQGMSLVALDNVLNGDPMQRRFHLDRRIKASDLLLQERVPVVAHLTQPKEDAAGVGLVAPDEGLDAVEHVGTPDGPTPRLHILAYGDFSIQAGASGSSWMAWNGLDVTRSRDDAALDAVGSLCYLRDLGTGAFWSSAYQPTRRRPDSYDVAFAADHISFLRRDGDVETLTEVTVSPEHPAEVRRMTITNRGPEPLELELTSYAEVVLAPRAADLAHPAFSKMFVETEGALERDAVLATRRPRSAGEPSPWVVHVMAVEAGHAGKLELETSRARFIGRGGTLEAPAAMKEPGPLSGSTGTVLDPILCLRRVLTVPAGGKAKIAFTTAIAASREVALELAETFRDARTIARTFELAWTDARVELKHLGVSAAQAQRFQRLASAIVFPSAGLRAAPAVIARNKRGKERLWPYGISGDLPILLVRLDDAESSDLLREVLLAHEFWRLNGFTVDLVIMNEEPSGYLQPQQDGALAVIRGIAAQVRLDQPGGVFLRRADQMLEPDYVLLQAIASVLLLSSQGSLTRQLRRAAPPPAALPAPFLPRAVAPREHPAAVVRPELALWNGLGGFRPDGREYVIVLDRHTRTPAPWCNVIANPRFGFLISESGSSFTWTDNSQSHRLTPWSNDPVIDPSGEALYLRDEDDGSVWSPTPAPAGNGQAYLVRHGQGYTTFELRRGDLGHELTVFAAADASVKIWRLRLTNAGARPRRLSAYGVVTWVLGTTAGRNVLSVVTEGDPETSAILASNPCSAFPGRVAFFAGSEVPRSFTGDRLEVFGRAGSRSAPAALARATLSGRLGAGLDPCAALQLDVILAPGETKEVLFVLGEGASRDEAVALARVHRDKARVQATFDAATRRWDEILGAVEVRTPDPSFDLLVNRWLLYQAVSCRLWARSAFYQSGGAYGFRDQLQDVLCLLDGSPEIAREQILRSAARQFREGDVQHWWHPESGQGVRTRYVDDLVWLPYVVARYVETTGDLALLDQPIPFLEERLLEAKDSEVFGVPAVSSEVASLYDHCVRALDRAKVTGPHGLPLMGGGDWNDGMNRVGEKGQGESVWMAWFLAATLRDFGRLAAARGDADRAGQCALEVTRLAGAVDATAWDGAWYRRAYFDDGTPLGSKENDECSIDALPQSWAVIAGVGDPGRARVAMRSTDERLVKPDDRMILLFTPPFAKTAHDPGYIKAYPAGLRENGGQYTHGALWSVLAQAMLGNGDRAAELFSWLNPIHHTEGPEQVARYQLEPYVVAADIYAAPGLVGRGGWSWYTGSAAWMRRIAVESILGITRHGAVLHVAPCIPSTWPRFEVVYRHGRCRYRIVVENPERQCGGVLRVELDGVQMRDLAIPLRDGGDHEVRVLLGAAPAPGAPLELQHGAGG